MSIYSDYKVGALSDEEFEWLAAREDRMERYWDERASEELYYHDDDERDEEDEYDECD